MTKNHTELSHAKWCRYLINVAYKGVIVNFVFSVFYYIYLVLMKNDIESQFLYWVEYIIIPTAVILMMTVFTDLLSRHKKTTLEQKKFISLYLISFAVLYIIITHNILAVLYMAFILPIFASTLFSDLKITRYIFLSSEVMLILAIGIVYLTTRRDYGIFLWFEAMVGFGIIIVSYFIAKGVIYLNQDTMASLAIMYNDKIALEEKIKIDPATNLFNKKVFEEYLEKVFIQSKADKLSLVLAIIDMDDFKRINDEHGHHQGDLVLRDIADKLRLIQNERIHSFRIGGEEFALIFEKTTIEEAVAICNTLGERLHQIKEDIMEKTGIKASIGIASITNGIEKSVDLFIAADKALYKAKAQGKDKVVVY